MWLRPAQAWAPTPGQPRRRGPTAVDLAQPARHERQERPLVQARLRPRALRRQGPSLVRSPSQPGPSDPHKIIRFVSDGQPITAKGKLAAFLLALIAAGSEGVAHVDCMPWQLNPGDAAKELRDRGVRIETRRGTPSRWILCSQVRQVQP